MSDLIIAVLLTAVGQWMVNRMPIKPKGTTDERQLGGAHNRRQSLG